MWTPPNMKFPKFLRQKGFEYVEKRGAVRYYQLILEIPQKINVAPAGFPVKVEQLASVVAALTVAKVINNKKNQYHISLNNMMGRHLEFGPFTETELNYKIERFLK
jgi:hypothetical protein